MVGHATAPGLLYRLDTTGSSHEPYLQDACRIRRAPRRGGRRSVLRAELEPARGAARGTRGEVQDARLALDRHRRHPGPLLRRSAGRRPERTRGGAEPRLVHESAQLGQPRRTAPGQGLPGHPHGLPERRADGLRFEGHQQHGSQRADHHRSARAARGLALRPDRHLVGRTDRLHPCRPAPGAHRPLHPDQLGRHAAHASEQPEPWPRQQHPAVDHPAVPLAQPVGKGPGTQYPLPASAPARLRGDGLRHEPARGRTACGARVPEELPHREYCGLSRGGQGTHDDPAGHVEPDPGAHRSRNPELLDDGRSIDDPQVSEARALPVHREPGRSRSRHPEVPRRRLRH